jgi:hypothetical protein
MPCRSVAAWRASPRGRRVTGSLVTGREGALGTRRLTLVQKRVQTFKIGYSKIQKIKEFRVLILFYVIHY